MVKKILDYFFGKEEKGRPAIHVRLEFDGNGVLMSMEYTNANPTFSAVVPFEEENDIFEGCGLTEEQRQEIVERVHPSNIGRFIEAFKAGESFEGLMRYFGDGHASED